MQSEFSQYYSNSGPEQVLIGCINIFEGISITSNQSLPKLPNFSVSINLNVDHNGNWKQTSVTLIDELSEYHPGFWQSSKLQNFVNVTMRMIVLFW